jgi:putative FmdB family regulatory protein
MPVYEYLCRKCRHKFTIFVQSSTGAGNTPVCARCQSTEIVRIFSTFSVRSKTDKEIYEDILSDQRLQGAMLAGDPKALAEWNKRMTQGLDQETTPEYEEMLERMEKGEMPTQLMQQLKGEQPEQSKESGEEKS